MSPVGRFGLITSARTRLDLAIDANDPFAAHRLGGLEGWRIRIGDDLGDAVMVAKIDKQQAAMVADAVDPAGEAHSLPDFRLSQLCAGVTAIAVHCNESDQ